jgi:type II secretory pathway component PulF
MSTPLGTITLDELLALNAEIGALVRSGVPLEGGLAALGRDMPGRLGAIATGLAERTAQGEPLAQILAEPAAKLPPLYRTVVEAGIRCGRLPAALESLAGSVRRVAETRRGIIMAGLYPMLVLLVAWGCFVFFTVRIAPSLAPNLNGLGAPGRELFNTLARWSATAMYWGPAVPLAVILVVAVWCRWSARASLAGSPWADVLLGWLPWMRRTLRWSRVAAFVEVLAMLVENHVPLPDAVRLAAGASGDRRLAPEAEKMAAALERGESFSGDTSRQLLPPLLRWLMAAAARQGRLAPALRHAADTYHRRARQQAELARVFLPVVLTIGLGGTVTMLYALMVFVPYVELMRLIGR